jgi:SAM-dependent methyltransferase
MSEYDKFAADFSATRQAGWPEFDLLAPHVRRSDRVLDLGCGNARLRKFLPVVDGNYFGLDLSEELLKIAREACPRDHFFRGNFGEPLPFGADNFEIVTAVASFHHLLSKKSQRQFFTEVFRVLKPGGTLFLTTWSLPQKYFWKNFGKKNWTIPFGPEKLPRTYRKTSAQQLRKNGAWSWIFHRIVYAGARKKLCSDREKMKRYFDAAASTPLDPRVVAEMQLHFEKFGNNNSRHGRGFESQKVIDVSLAKIADLLGVAPAELAIAYSGTDANRRFLWACARRWGWEKYFRFRGRALVGAGRNCARKSF